jgi:hypothetical protein
VTKATEEHKYKKWRKKGVLKRLIGLTNMSAKICFEKLAWSVKPSEEKLKKVGMILGRNEFAGKDLAMCKLRNLLMVGVNPKEVDLRIKENAAKKILNSCSGLMCVAFLNLKIFKENHKRETDIYIANDKNNRERCAKQIIMEWQQLMSKNFEKLRGNANYLYEKKSNAVKSIMDSNRVKLDQGLKILKLHCLKHQNWESKMNNSSEKIVAKILN